MPTSKHPQPSVRTMRESARSSRRVEAATDAARMVLDLVRSTTEEVRPPRFSVLRAHGEVERLPDGTQRRVLGRILSTLDPTVADEGALVSLLLEWVGHLESRRHLPEASDVLAVAMDLRPDDPELALHAARLARKAGKRSRAQELYDRVESLDADGGELRRMAAIGRALLDPRPEEALGREIRGARRAGDDEAAAVAHEERARVRREQGDLEGALRDYGVAARRFSDPADRGRIGHEAADLLISRGQPLAARLVLLAALDAAHPAQVERARSRLRLLARSMGDDVGLRRWSGAEPPSLVSLAPSMRGDLPVSETERRVDRLLRRLGART